MRTLRQCQKCPWKVSTDPREIPGGYCEGMHRELEATIADPGAYRSDAGLRMMACYASRPGQEFACAGWLANQLGPGNNLPLRMAALRGNAPEFELDGEQHERFEDTLP